MVEWPLLALSLEMSSSLQVLITQNLHIYQQEHTAPSVALRLLRPRNPTIFPHWRNILTGKFTFSKSKSDSIQILYRFIIQISELPQINRWFHRFFSFWFSFRWSFGNYRSFDFDRCFFRRFDFDGCFFLYHRSTE